MLFWRCFSSRRGKVVEHRPEDAERGVESAAVVTERHSDAAAPSSAHHDEGLVASTDASSRAQAIAQPLPAWRLLQIDLDALEALVPRLLCIGEAHGPDMGRQGHTWNILLNDAEVHVALHMAANAAAGANIASQRRSQSQEPLQPPLRFVKLSEIPRVPYSFLLITAHEGHWPLQTPVSGSVRARDNMQDTQHCAQSLRQMLSGCPEACDALMQLVGAHESPGNMEAAVILPLGHSQEGRCLQMSHALVETPEGTHCCCLVLELLQPGAGSQRSSSSQNQSVLLPAPARHSAVHNPRKSVSITGAIAALPTQTSQTQGAQGSCLPSQASADFTGPRYSPVLRPHAAGAVVGQSSSSSNSGNLASVSVEQERLVRSMAMLSKAPLMLTLVDLSSGVVQQNEASLGYWGVLQPSGPKTAGHIQAPQQGVISAAALALLQVLALDEQQLMHDMLLCVCAGVPWKRIMRVPHLARLHSSTSSSGRVDAEQNFPPTQLCTDSTVPPGGAMVADVAGAAGTMQIATAGSVVGTSSSQAPAMISSSQVLISGRGTSESAPLGHRQPPFAFWPVLEGEPVSKTAAGAPQPPSAGGPQRLANSDVLQPTAASTQPAQSLRKVTGHQRRPKPLQVPPYAPAIVEGVPYDLPAVHGLDAPSELGLDEARASPSECWPILGSGLLVTNAVTDSTRLSILAASLPEAAVHGSMISQQEQAGLGTGAASPGLIASHRRRAHSADLPIDSSLLQRRRVSLESSRLSGLGPGAAMMQPAGISRSGMHPSPEAETGQELTAAGASCYSDSAQAKDRGSGSWMAFDTSPSLPPTVPDPGHGASTSFAAGLAKEAPVQDGVASSSQHALDSMGQMFNVTMAAGLAPMYGSVDAAEFPTSRNSRSSKQRSGQREGSLLHHPKPRHTRSEMLSAHLLASRSVNSSRAIATEGGSVPESQLQGRTISWQLEGTDPGVTTQSASLIGIGGAAAGTKARVQHKVKRVQSATGSPRFNSRLSPQSDALWSEMAGTPIRPSAKLRSLIAAQSSGMSMHFDSDSSSILPSKAVRSGPLAGRMEDGSSRLLPHSSAYSSPSQIRGLSAGISQRLLLSTDIARSSGGHTSAQGSTGMSSAAGSVWGDPKLNSNSQCLYHESDGAEFTKPSASACTPIASQQASPQHSFLMPYDRMSSGLIQDEGAEARHGQDTSSEVPTLSLPPFLKAAPRLPGPVSGLPGLPEAGAAAGVEDEEDEEKDQFNNASRQETGVAAEMAAGSAEAAAAAMGPLEWSDGQLAWHEVEALPFKDPVTGKDMLMLAQADVTTRVELDMRIACLTESQVAMLDQMFPRHVLEFLAMTSGAQASPIGLPVPSLIGLASQTDNVSILFTDVVGFTDMSKQVQPAQVMQFLNHLFTLLDDLIDSYEIFKVETAGDCYIVAGGLMTRDAEGFLVLDHNADHVRGAEKVMAFAKALLRCAKTVNMPHNGQPTTVRVGIHTGPVVSGLIGSKLPKFSIFGDTMNTASRMESTCKPGCIHVSETTYQLLSNHTFSSTGGIDVKGKGWMQTYLWDPSEHPEEAYASSQEQQQEATALVNHISKQLPGRASPVAKVQSALDKGGLRKALQVLESSSEAAGAVPGPSRVSSPPLPGRVSEVIKLFTGEDAAARLASCTQRGALSAVACPISESDGRTCAAPAEPAEGVGLSWRQLQEHVLPAAGSILQSMSKSCRVSADFNNPDTAGQRTVALAAPVAMSMPRATAPAAAAAAAMAALSLKPPRPPSAAWHRSSTAGYKQPANVLRRLSLDHKLTASAGPSTQTHGGTTQAGQPALGPDLEKQRSEDSLCSGDAVDREVTSNQLAYLSSLLAPLSVNPVQSGSVVQSGSPAPSGAPGCATPS